MKKLIARFFGITFFALLVLTAASCSSGGGDVQSPGSSPPPPPPPPGTHRISGTIHEITESGSVYRRPAQGVTVRAEPAGATTTTNSSGEYEFFLPNGAYTIVPAYVNYSFTPAARNVVVNSVIISGIDFTGSIPTLRRGMLAYVGTGSVGNTTLELLNLATNVVGVLLDNPNIQPQNIIPFRGGVSRIAFEPALSGNERNGGIRTIDLATLAQVVIVPDSGFFAPGFVSSPLGRVFDTIRDPNTGSEYVVFSSPCPPGPQCTELQNDVFVVIADGSLRSLRATIDGAIKHSPVFAGQDPATGYVALLYVKPNTNDLWMQVINPAGSPDRIGEPVLIERSVVDAVRSISVSPDYTRFAFMRNVGGVPHVIVRPVIGGAELDLGEGSNPYWTIDGNDLIMYTIGGVVLAVHPDGTGKVEIPVPSGLQVSKAWMVLVGS